VRFSRFLLLSLFAGSSLAAACKGKFGFDGDPFVPEPPGPRPQYGATVSQAESPRPISGGTLLVTGNRAVVADPDRDAIVIVDLGSKSKSAIALNAGDDPGRSVADDKGRVHVVLRGAGEIATIDLATSALTRTKICTAPRGIAFDPGSAAIRVACADGSVKAMATADLSVSLTATGPKDLRDIVMAGGEIWVSRFRASDILVLDRAGNLLRTMKPQPQVVNGALADASVAWRMVPYSTGVVLVHQRGRDPSAPPVKVTEGGYTAESGQGTDGSPVVDDGSGSTDPSPPPLRSKCKLGIVQSAVTDFEAFSSGMSRPSISSAVLPVDIAINGFRRVLVSAGNAHTPELDSLVLLDGSETNAFDCVIPQKNKIPNPPGQPVAAAFDGSSRLIVQLREPAMLVVYQPELDKIVDTIPYGDGSREDTGHAIFHSNSGGFLACASCHPEGGDDGRVWSFEGVGVRRTQNLRGGVKAPFHWNGELADLGALTSEVLSKRMSGPSLEPDQLAALGKFIEHIPMMPAMPGIDAAAIARGKAVFESAQCSTCHTGERFSNASIVDVGTGGTFKVPSLRGLAWRAPYMHTGCAGTLEDRFNSDCGGGTHGKIDLATADRSDLISYLQSL
jgi:hypothetical protein